VVARLRLLAIATLAALLLAVPAALADPSAEKASIDARIEQLRERIDAAKDREHVLTTDIAAASEQIDAVQGRVDDLSAKVAALEQQLASHRARLAELRELHAQQTRTLAILERTKREADRRLAARVVEIYTSGEPSTLEVVLSVSSLDQLISRLEYADQIAQQDENLAAEVGEASAALALERARTAAIEDDERKTTALLADETAEKQAVLGELVSRRDQLVGAQADREALLASLRADRHDAEEDVDELARASARLAEQLRAGTGSPGGASTGGGAAPSSGFVWPVHGPITSPFGMRWGRMHEGIDIGVGFGTPIASAAAGTVVYAGWLGGYGNLVVVDHGGGLSTAYGHQQRIYVSYGQQVGQGDILGEVGSTGHSFGPHLHFEVRVNGSPVDPLGYL
jgi:murein DD-endopeptidase MepM/ murein hydrolase activator NlpD